MRITACPRCGSRRIYAGTMGDGVLVGYTTKDVCRDGGYQGMPLIFDSEKEYGKFLEGLQKNKELVDATDSEKDVRDDKKNNDDVLKLSKKDREVMGFLNELKKEKIVEESTAWYKNKTWRKEIIVSLVFSAIIIFASFQSESLLYGTNFAMLCDILLFIPLALLLLLWIIFIEYIYDYLKNMLKEKI